MLKRTRSLLTLLLGLWLAVFTASVGAARVCPHHLPATGETPAPAAEVARKGSAPAHSAHAGPGHIGSPEHRATSGGGHQHALGAVAGNALSDGGACPACAPAAEPAAFAEPSASVEPATPAGVCASCALCHVGCTLVFLTAPPGDADTGQPIDAPSIDSAPALVSAHLGKLPPPPDA